MMIDADTPTLPEVINLLREPTVTVEEIPLGFTQVTLWSYGTAHGGSSKTITLSRKETLALRDQLNAILG